MNKQTMIIITVIALLYFMSGQNTNQSSCDIYKADRAYDPVTFCTMAEAQAKATEIGCEGTHMHQQDGENIYMACMAHADLDTYVNSAGNY